MAFLHALLVIAAFVGVAAIPCALGLLIISLEGTIGRATRGLRRTFARLIGRSGRAGAGADRAGRAADAGRSTDGGRSADTGRSTDRGRSADAGRLADDGSPVDGGPFADAGRFADDGSAIEGGSFAESGPAADIGPFVDGGRSTGSGDRGGRSRRADRVGRDSSRNRGRDGSRNRRRGGGGEDRRRGGRLLRGIRRLTQAIERRFLRGRLGNRWLMARLAMSVRVGRKLEHSEPTSPPIQQVAADLRRLNRQRLSIAMRSRVWFQAVQHAYDDRLGVACRQLSIEQHLDELTGMDLDLERVRVEGLLEEAGLAFGDDSTQPRHWQL